MKKGVLFLCLMILGLAQAKAQRLFFLFAHGEYASAVGDLKNGYDKGLGVEAGLGVGMNKTFFTATTGYTWLQTADNSATASNGNLRYNPVKIGIRRYVFRKNIFLKADAGLANMKYDNHASGSSHFTAGAGAGVKFMGLEVLADYTTVTGGYGSWLSLKAGFTFGL